MAPQFDPGLGVGWTNRVENGTNRNVVRTFLFDYNTHYRPILHRLAKIHNAADRQTADRAIRIGRLCYSIGGLPNNFVTAAAEANIGDNIEPKSFRVALKNVIM